jgi:predicted RNase H-like nuclease (RuvC/YqgF family)
MTKILTFTLLALILLGVLISNTVHMTSDMQTLKNENRQLENQVGQMQIDNSNLIQENDALKNSNSNLQNQMNLREQAYQTEHAARLSAEATVNTLSATLASLPQQPTTAQSLPTSSCEPTTTGKLPILAAGVGVTGLLSFLALRKPRKHSHVRVIRGTQVN